MIRSIPIVTVLLTLAFSNVSYGEQAPSLSAALYKKLAKTQELIDDDKFEESVTQLTNLTQKLSITAYESGMIWHMLGYTYWEKGETDKSIKALEQVQEFEVPLSLELSNRKLLAQVYMHKNRYSKALPHLNYWLEHSSDDKEEMHIITAQCYFQMQRYQSAVEHIHKAININREKNLKPKEHWLTLLQSSLAHLDEAKDRVNTIKLLLTWYPKPEYWLALAGAYAQLEKMDNYLAVLSLARRKNLLKSEAQYLSLASVYFSEGIPIKAAQVIEEGFSRSIVPHNVKNLRFLASSYSMAREYDQAINPLQRAAKQAKDGKVHMLLGNAYFQLARWEDASAAFEVALQKGNLDQEATTWMFLGQSFLNQKEYDKASAAFEQAALDEEKAKHAQQWLEYIAYEKERYQSLHRENDAL